MKITGNYCTVAARNVIKAANRLFCQVVGEEIYLTSGPVLFHLSAQEYTDIVQPVTGCAPGNWIIENKGRPQGYVSNLASLYAKCITDVDNCAPLINCPLLYEQRESLICCYYYGVTKETAFYNSAYIDALSPGTVLRATSGKSVAVAYTRAGNAPFALIMPINLKNEALKRAVIAYMGD